MEMAQNATEVAVLLRVAPFDNYWPHVYLKYSQIKSRSTGRVQCRPEFSQHKKKSKMCHDGIYTEMIIFWIGWVKQNKLLQINFTCFFFFQCGY